MRPIDADALIEKCGGWYVDECTESGFIGTLENLLATEPTIQPQSTTGQLNDGARSTAQSTDLIDRQAAIDAIENSSKPYVWQGADIIRRLPTVQPEPQWIPVSERLPEDLEEVNVTWVNRNPESYYESIKDKPFTATAVYYKGKWYWWSTYTQDLLAEYGERCSVGLLHEDIEVTAWMPLPEPYKPNNK